MKAIIFGAGKIARGFVAHLLQLSGISITFVEYNKDLVKALNERGSYHVEIMGDATQNIEITGYQALALSDHEAIARAWAEAPLAFTCVGGKNLVGLAKDLADIIQRRSALTTATTNLITCENWKVPAEILRKNILEALPPESIPSFRDTYGFSEAVVMRSAVEPTAEQLAQDPLWVSVQNFWELPVDRSRIIGEPVPVHGIHYIEGFSGYLERKFYTYNAANGTTSFLGHLRGHKYLYDAATDPWIVDSLHHIYEETGCALVKKHGITMEQQLDFAASSLRKLQDPSIIDYVERNARDPIRKLGAEDRLVGSARLVEKYGIEPKYLARSIAAAIHYFEANDPGAQELARLLKEEGVDAVLLNVCKINPEEPLGKLVKKSIQDLRKEGILK